MTRASILPLLLVASAVSVGQQTPPWEAEMLRFEEMDRQNPPKPGGIVFVGSSSMAMWGSLAKDFPGYNVINRGFGGSQIADSVRNVHRLVTKHRPRMVVFFAGTNDIASGKKAETVAEDYRAFVKGVRSKLPRTKIVFMSITPVPSRQAMWPEMAKANAMIKEFTRRDANLVYMDVYDRMLTPSGGPRPELFLGDQLHMNPSGYAIWIEALRPILPKESRL